MNRAPATQRARMAALVWCFRHLDDPLTVEGLAGVLLGLDEAAHGTDSPARGACPPNLAAELRLDDAAAALQELEHEGLVYRRRDGGRQLTDGGLVMARAAAGAFDATWARVMLEGSGRAAPAGLVGDRSGLTPPDDGDEGPGR